METLETPTSGRFAEALAYAARLHSTQSRKGTQVPYIAHLMAVAALVFEHGGSEDEAIGGLLHDAAEDQGGHETLEAIRHAFGNEVANIVEACTDTFEDPRPVWKPRKEAYVASIATKSPSAVLVSACDKLHNSRSILADLKTDPNVWDRFNAEKHDTLWYYQALCQAFVTRVEDPAMPHQFRQLVDELECVVAELVADSQ